MRSRITEIVASRYDLGRIEDVYEITSGFTNRSFAVTVNKSGRINRYLVRKYKVGTTPNEIRFEHAVIRHAIESGFTSSAGVVENIAGETFIQCEDNNDIFAVYDYLAGEDKYAWDNPNLTDNEFQSAAGVLADFHNAVRRFQPVENNRKEPPIQVLWTGLAEKLALLAGQKRAGTFQPYFNGRLKSIQDTIASIRFDPEKTARLPVLPAHYDYHPGNLKWDQGRVVGIFDFDWCKMDLRLFDVCMACVYFCADWRSACDGELRMDKFFVFLQAYQRRLLKAKGLDSIKEPEQGLIPDMLTAATIYLIHWVVDDYLEKESADDQQHQIYLSHSIRLMRWLESHRPDIQSQSSAALT